MRTKVVKKRKFGLFATSKIGTRALFCAALSLCACAARGEVISTIVIDPGHGGKDPGAVHGKHQEKDIVLDVAKRFGRLVSERYPAMKVIYTRSTDVFVELRERGAIANRARADLFLSIHVNSTAGTAPSGSETFVMGTTKGAANLEVAMRENDVISFEEDPLTKYQGYVPGSSESLIMFNLMQYSYREQSMALARDIQSRYRAATRLPDRGVKEAGFLVLWSTAMPSILTELGFINNAQDIKLLGSEAGRDGYARSLFNAFCTYKTRAEGRGDRIVSHDTPADVAATERTAELPARPGTPEGEVVFAIQVMASPVHIPAGDPRFGEYRGKVSEIEVGGLYKYYVEECGTYRQARDAQGRVKKRFRDAFMIALLDGRPVPVDEARKLVTD